eukprot:1426228-Pyramimonas_sp.AAC.1
MRVIGMTLPNHLKIGRTQAFDSAEESQLCAGSADELWVEHQAERRQAKARPVGFRAQEWRDA